MKKQITLITLIIFSIFANAQTSIALDTINTNTVWADTIFLNSNVYIENGVQLKIKPGAVVIANDWYGIDCQGQILAQGTEQDSIKFTVADTTNFFDIYKTLGGWRGLNFDSTLATNDSSLIDFCILEYGKTADTSNYNIKSDGGAIFCNYFNKLIISNSTFKNNYSQGTGGAICLKYSTIIIYNNLFNNNWSIDRGAGIFIFEKSKTLVKENVFLNGRAGKKDSWLPPGEGIIYQAAGSAICVSNSSNYFDDNGVIIINNKFYNNNSTNGTIYISSIYSNIANNILCNNNGTVIFASNGGFWYYTKMVFTNNVIVNNSFDIGLDNRIVFLSDHVNFYNNIVIANLNNTNNPDSLISVLSWYSSPIFSPHSYIKYNYLSQQTPTDGEGNIYGTTPLFVNPSPNTDFVANWQDYDWRLQVTSPCINAGTTDTNGLELPEQDAFGNPRIFGGRVDIGAYENQTEVWNNVFSLENKLELTYYPNPVRNSLQLKINNVQLQKQDLQIFDINGKLVKQIAINNEAITIDVSDLETGVYYLRLGGLSKEFIKY